MTHREIVIEALEHRATNPIPYHIELTQQAIDRLISETGNKDIEKQLGTFLHYTQYWGWPTEMPDKPLHFKDEFGVIWNRTVDHDIGNVDNVLIADLEENTYQFPKPDLERLRSDIENLIASRGENFCFMGFGFCMFERSWSLMGGMTKVLESMMVCPDELEDFFRQICDYFLILLDVALEYKELDGIYFGDDWGQQHGMIMGPAHWRRLIKPQMARLYSRVKAAGKYVLQHSCGDNHEILGDLIDIGLDCYQTFQPEIYDIADIKKRFGKHLSFWGGVSTQKVLPYVKPDELKKEIVRVVNILRGDGGLIIAPTHAMPRDIPSENILAMAEVFQHQDKYF